MARPSLTSVRRSSPKPLPSGKIVVAVRDSWDFVIARYLGRVESMDILKTVQYNQPIHPGDPLTYTIVVANNGEGDAKGVVVMDTLPPYLNDPNLNQTSDIAAGRV